MFCRFFGAPPLNRLLDLDLLFDLILLFDLDLDLLFDLILLFDLDLDLLLDLDLDLLDLDLLFDLDLLILGLDFDLLRLIYYYSIDNYKKKPTPIFGVGLSTTRLPTSR